MFDKFLNTSLKRVVQSYFAERLMDNCSIYILWRVVQYIERPTCEGKNKKHTHSFSGKTVKNNLHDQQSLAQFLFWFLLILKFFAYKCKLLWFLFQSVYLELRVLRVRSCFKRNIFWLNRSNSNLRTLV